MNRNPDWTEQENDFVESLFALLVRHNVKISGVSMPKFDSGDGEIFMSSDYVLNYIRDEMNGELNKNA